MMWEEIAILASFISLMIATLLYMLSKFFDFKTLEASAKSEIIFALSSFLIVVFLIAVVNYGVEKEKIIIANMYANTYNNYYLHYYNESGAVNELKPSDFNSLSPIDIVTLYIRSTMFCAEKMGSVLYIVSMVAHLISTPRQDVFMAYPISSWAWGGVAQTMDNFLNTIYFLDFIYRLEIYILEFVDDVSLTLLLPLGIILRAFPLTRGAGAYIIALTLALYLVFPMAYLAIAFSTKYSYVCHTPVLPPPNLENTSSLGKLWGLISWWNAFESSIKYLLSNISSLLTPLLTNLCLLPVVVLSITLSATQSMSGLFGAHIPEVGRGLVKLI